MSASGTDGVRPGIKEDIVKSEPIFLEPVLKETIWGGKRLAEYGYKLPSDTVGEAWAISGHPHGDCVIRSGAWKGQTLGGLWKEHPELFGNPVGEQFPLLIKIIDARTDLSIQVHPDDAYASAHEGGSLGKTECWYILDCEPGTEIVIGHNARTKEELCRMMDEGKWDELIRKVPVHPGDFFQIDPGCVHAIKGGTLILETQQSSDITYRVYDYGRLQNGKPRALHLRQSKDVISVPFEECGTQPVAQQVGDGICTKLISCGYYTVMHYELDGKMEQSYDQPFVNVSILEGEGFFGEYPVKKGDHFLLPAQFGDVCWKGKLKAMLSWPPA